MVGAEDAVRQGLLYRGHKILPYCPRCGTALSSHEVAQGYEDVEDPSVYVRARPGRRRRRTPAPARRILVWTTTPWTLVSNTALAVHPDLDYVEVVRRKTGQGYRERSSSPSRACRAVLGEDYDDRWEIVRPHARRATSSGARYRGRSTGSSIPAGTNHEVIVGEDFVSADDGTGVVHMSPAFGADDYAAGQRHNLAFLQPVDARGEFPASMPLVGGMFVKDADPLIIEELKRRGVLWKAGAAHALVSALLALRHAAALLRAHVVVRAHDRVQGRRCWRATRASIGIRRRWARGGSANGSRTTSTGRSRATGTGARRCRCGCATPTPRTSR